MEPRRPGAGGRAVTDPKVRLVGFYTAQERTHPSPHPAATTAVTDMSPVSDSISPVMIPLPRHTFDSHAMRRHQPMADTMPVGSYNPVESFLEMSLAQSPSSSRVSGGDTLATSTTTDSISLYNRSNSGMFASSFPKGGFDFAHRKGSDALLDATNSAVEVSEKRRGSGKVVQSESSDPKPLKEKTTKSERRALQESQRAAKAAAKGVGSKQERENESRDEKQKKDATTVHIHQISPSTTERMASERGGDKERKKEVPPPRMQFDDKSRVEKAKKRAVVKQTEVRNRVELFRHLPQYEHGTQLPHLESNFFHLHPIHPAVYKVGLQFMAGDVSGGNARCRAMLEAFREVISDYSTPTEKNLGRDLTAKIGSHVSFLTECRPLSISMGNTIRFLKSRITKLPPGTPEADAKAVLCSEIDRYVNEKIVLADNIIVRQAISKVSDGDVLLVYGSPHVVGMLLLYAHSLGIRFRVVVVDSRPKFEGREMLRKLVDSGISCTYTHINAVSYVMHEVTRVFLGAASVFSNGTVYSRVGTAGVAMVAHAFHVPVLVCCEAYKFHERVQLDSICFNELGDPGVISEAPGNGGGSGVKDNLQHLNLLYDVTPSDYISMIVTDYGMIPPTSVPVIVHDYRRELM